MSSLNRPSASPAIAPTAHATPPVQAPMSTAHGLDLLLSWGMERADADEWLSSDLPLDRALVERALSADRLGISPGAFTSWCELKDWSPADASKFTWAGFSEPEAAFAVELIRHIVYRKPGRRVDELDDQWLDAPLSPAWICRALAIGLTRPDAALGLFRRSIAEPGLVMHLDICADFRGANNRDLVIDRELLAQMGVQRS